MDIFLLYLWTRLDALGALIQFAIFAGAVGSMLAGLAWFIESDFSDEKADKYKTYMFNIAKLTMIPIIAALIIPSQKDVAVIAGGWMAKEIATSDKAQQIGAKTFQLINGKLDEELAKLNEKEEQ